MPGHREGSRRRCPKVTVWHRICKDTIEAGAGIVDEEDRKADDVHQAAERILDLLEVGVPFDKDLEGKLRLSREAAHSANRDCARFGRQGWLCYHGSTSFNGSIEIPSIRIVSGYQAERLHMEGRYVSGVIARNRANESGQ